MADEKVDQTIIELFAALKELGELRHRYDSVTANVKDRYVCLCVSGYSPFINCFRIFSI